MKWRPQGLKASSGGIPGEEDAPEGRREAVGKVLDGLVRDGLAALEVHAPEGRPALRQVRRGCVRDLPARLAARNEFGPLVVIVLR